MSTTSVNLCLTVLPNADLTHSHPELSAFTESKNAQIARYVRMSMASYVQVLLYNAAGSVNAQEWLPDIRQFCSFHMFHHTAFIFPDIRPRSALQ